MTQSGRGGKREGAGAPLKTAEPLNKHMRVSEGEKKLLLWVREQKINPN